MAAKEDKHIIKQIKNGDVAAYSVLIERYRHMVFTLALQLLKNEADAEEVAQDAFLKAYRALDKFEGRSSFSTWIYKITYFQAISKLRKSKKKEVGYDEDFNGYEKSQFTEDLGTDLLEAQDRSRFLKIALGKIKGEEATVLTLFYFEDLKTEEIAEITGMSVSNVKVRLHRGRQNLLKELKVALKKEAASLL
ncbi:RNA polymerase sigma factor [Marinilabilia rubra]|uniref:RNA polymerase sigma factor n=1 Tax=Marinilabilia rubra TaxID=2162893 RepID=A0A2U2B7N5_9BACT|nr:RNA polymerase sigma factor [Marinilabilia rubra]PWD99065.1 RNA polymerase subunit sigma-24 [Marinilabilia rubra]